MGFFEDIRPVLEEETDSATAERICERIAAELGGRRWHIPRRSEIPEVRCTDTPQTLQRRYGVSRSTAYNWLNAWRNK